MGGRGEISGSYPLTRFPFVRRTIIIYNNRIESGRETVLLKNFYCAENLLK